MGEIKMQGITAYSKFTALGLLTLLVAGIFDSARLLAFRPKWIDLPMLIWCLCPFASSLANGLGAHDGVSAITLRILSWGLPYLVGRIYFCDLEGARELAIGIFLGGLVYVVPCLYEIKMSPLLHHYVYGFDHAWSMIEARRWGGWRPIVFMQHGLMVGAWMAAASLVGIWLYVSKSVRKILGIGMVWWLLPLVVTTVLCKSTGALAIMAIGVLALLLGRWMKTSVFLWCFVLIAPLYMGFRASGQWSGDGMVTVARALTNEDRAGSLAFRLRNEDLINAHSLEQPVFGWGSWGRNRVTNDQGEDISVTDGLWVIALGQNGLIGLTGLTLILTLPGILLLRRYRGVSWSDPSVAPVAALAMAVTLCMIDCLMNAMVNPIYTLAAGTMGIYFMKEPLRIVRRVPPQQMGPKVEWKSNLGKFRLPPRIGET
jgi:hypothetical protein